MLFRSDAMIGSISSKLNGTEISVSNPIPSYLNYEAKAKDGMYNSPFSHISIKMTKEPSQCHPLVSNVAVSHMIWCFWFWRLKTRVLRYDNIT